MEMYTEPVMKKRFSGQTIKETKVKALKWLGKYVMCKDELQDLTFSFTEEDKQQFPTIVLTIFVSIDSKEVMARHCEICHEFHKSFFINEQCNCDECKSLSMQHRMQNMIRVKKTCYSQKLKHAIEKGYEEDE